MTFSYWAYPNFPYNTLHVYDEDEGFTGRLIKGNIAFYEEVRDGRNTGRILESSKWLQSDKIACDVYRRFGPGSYKMHGHVVIEVIR